jgi:hypothetical protein
MKFLDKLNNKNFQRKPHKMNLVRNRGSAVVFRWATGFMIEDSSPGMGWAGDFFFSSPPSRPALGHTQPSVQWVPGTVRPGCETDHSLSPTADVEK